MFNVVWEGRARISIPKVETETLATIPAVKLKGPIGIYDFRNTITYVCSGLPHQYKCLKTPMVHLKLVYYLGQYSIHIFDIENYPDDMDPLEWNHACFNLEQIDPSKVSITKRVWEPLWSLEKDGHLITLTDGYHRAVVSFKKDHIPFEVEGLYGCREWSLILDTGRDTTWDSYTWYSTDEESAFDKLEKVDRMRQSRGR